MTEDEIKQQIRQYFGLRKDMRLFTNPVGNGWMGEARTHTNGLVVLTNPRRVSFGLCQGSSDLIGWISQNNIARFLALELKSNKGRATEEQLNFIEQVRSGGGIAGVVRSIEDVKKLLQESQ